MRVSDVGTNEAFAARETNPLTNSKDIIQKGQKSTRLSGRARSTRELANEAWALCKSNSSRVSRGDLSRDRYIACPKLAFPAGNTFARRAIVQLSQSRVGRALDCRAGGSRV